MAIETDNNLVNYDIDSEDELEQEMDEDIEKSM